MDGATVVLSASSTSPKFAAHFVDATALPPQQRRGRIDSPQGDPHFNLNDATGKQLAAPEWREDHAPDHTAALQLAMTWPQANLAGAKVVAAGHRTLLGGTQFEGPGLTGAEVLNYLEGSAVVEPSHQPFNVRDARAFAKVSPGLPQVGCFDSAFRRPMPVAVQTYASPKNVRGTGARRRGCHCISFDFISRQIPKHALSARWVIAAHISQDLPTVRNALCRKVEWLWSHAGRRGQRRQWTRVTRPESRAPVRIIPTNEVLMVTEDMPKFIR